MPVRFPDGTLQAPHLQKFDGCAPHESRKAFHGGQPEDFRGTAMVRWKSSPSARRVQNQPRKKHARIEREKRPGGRVRGIAPLAGACPPRKEGAAGAPRQPKPS